MTGLGDGYDYVTPEQFIPKKGIPARTGKPPGGNDPGGDGFFRLILFLMKIPGIRGWLTKADAKICGWHAGIDTGASRRHILPQNDSSPGKPA